MYIYVHVCAPFDSPTLRARKTCCVPSKPPKPYKSYTQMLPRPARLGTLSCDMILLKCIVFMICITKPHMCIRLSQPGGWAIIQNGQKYNSPGR